VSTDLMESGYGWILRLFVAEYCCQLAECHPLEDVSTYTDGDGVCPELSVVALRRPINERRTG